MSRTLDRPADVGTTVRVSAMFENLDDPTSLIDPHFIVCITKNALGAERVQPVFRDTLGEFHAEILVPHAGQWWYRFTTTNPVRVVEGSFVVRKSLYGVSTDPALLTGTPWGSANWGEFNWPIDFTWP